MATNASVVWGGVASGLDAGVWVAPGVGMAMLAPDPATGDAVTTGDGVTVGWSSTPSVRTSKKDGISDAPSPPARPPNEYVPHSAPSNTRHIKQWEPLRLPPPGGGAGGHQAGPTWRRPPAPTGAPLRCHGRRRLVVVVDKARAPLWPSPRSVPTPQMRSPHRH